MKESSTYNRITIKNSKLLYKNIGLFGSYILLICLPIMTIYTWRKGLQANLLLKLVTLYFLSMTIFILATVYPTIYPKELHMKIYVTYVDFRCLFCVSACLWLNVICIQIWSEYRRTSSVLNQDRIRLVLYSLYVWGISIILTYIQHISEETNGSEHIGNWIMLGITCFNILTFLILSVNICTTRCKVIHISNEENLKFQLLLLIIRLGLMMGFPRMLIMTLSFFVYFDYSLCMYFCIPEPFIIFTVLVWKPNVAAVSLEPMK